MKIHLFFVLLMLISLYTPALGLRCAHVLTTHANTQKDLCIDPRRGYGSSYRWCNSSEKEMNPTGGEY
jgi:hypothetical protein